jgi:hypothetical protein
MLDEDLIKLNRSLILLKIQACTFEEKSHEEHYFSSDFLPWTNDNGIRAGTAGSKAVK